MAVTPYAPECHRSLDWLKLVRVESAQKEPFENESLLNSGFTVTGILQLL